MHTTVKYLWVTGEKQHRRMFPDCAPVGPELIEHNHNGKRFGFKARRNARNRTLVEAFAIKG